MPEVASLSEIETTAATQSPSVDVYAVFGAEPEILAYAMAKYSRSALSMKESLKEISQQKAEKFLNTFYFQYGHRSIADLAHIAMAIERFPSWRPLPWPTSSAGMARSAPLAIRISKRADTSPPTSAVTGIREICIERPSKIFSRNMNLSRNKCSNTWLASRPSPRR